MPSKAKPMSSKGFPNLKKKLSTLVQETSFRAFTKKATKLISDSQPQADPKVRPDGKINVPTKVRDSLLDDTLLGDFKPFDIDLSTLESFRPPENRSDIQRQDQLSATPIADNFTRNSIQAERAPQCEHKKFGSNPATLPKFETRTDSALLGRVSIDVRVSPTDARHFHTQEPLNRQTPPDQLIEVEPPRTREIQSQSVNPDDTTKIPPKHEDKAVRLLKPVGSCEHPAARNLAETFERLNSSKRHSMPPSIPNELLNRPSVAHIKESLAQRSVSSPQERRFSLQPASPATATPVSTSTQAFLSRTSTRLSDRLAWIRELEDGKNNSKNPGHDFALKNVQGGVADKLAKFESKQLNGSLTRTNSTISRISSVDAYGVESSQVSVMSRISTVDTSNRASSVFTNFEESFRGKMEMLAGTLADRTQEESSGKEKSTSKITSKFIPVATTTSNSETTIMPQEVIEFTTLCNEDSENVISDMTNHRSNLGSVLSCNGNNAVQQLDNVTNSALTELPLSHINKRSSSIEKKWRPAPNPIQIESPLAKPRLSNLHPRVASGPPAVSMGTAMDINYVPRNSVLDTQSIKAMPLTIDEQKANCPASPVKSEESAEKLGDPATPKFNPAALPLFVHK